MKNLLSILLCLMTSVSFGQIESVDFLMKYNCETNQYDVNLVILEGSASTVAQRVQFNSQISIVVPTGETLVITNKNMPLQSNQEYDGTTPLDWGLSNPIYSPAAQPENDFYPVIPKLAPASFYNNLQEGEIVYLFSFISGATGQYNENVRFYNSDIDPDHSDPGMGGGDFSNGFAIGGPTQIYNGNVEESCLTGIEEYVSFEANVYPNPFVSHFTIELPTDIKSVRVIDSEGKTHYESSNKSKGILKINAHDYPSGVYYLRIETVSDVTSRRLLKI